MRARLLLLIQPLTSRRMVHDTDIIELELKSKKYNLSLRKREAVVLEQQSKQMQVRVWACGGGVPTCCRCLCMHEHASMVRDHTCAADARPRTEHGTHTPAHSVRPRASRLHGAASTPR